MTHLTEQEKRKECLWNAIGEVMCGLLMSTIGIMLFLYVNMRTTVPIEVDIIPVALAFTLCFISIFIVIDGAQGIKENC